MLLIFSVLLNKSILDGFGYWKYLCW